MDCALLSAYIPPYAPKRYYSYVRTLNRYFRDSDIIVGINPQGLTAVRPLGREQVFVAPNPLVVNSDVTGYQECLKHVLGKNYRYVYFFHTKGISHRTNESFQTAQHNFFNSLARKRKIVESVLADPNKGAWSEYGRYRAKDDMVYFDSIGWYINNFTHDWNRVEYLHTLYVIKGEVLQKFFEGVDNAFWSKNLSTLGYNRWFFEHIFPTIVERYGYSAHVDKWYPDEV